MRGFVVLFVITDWCAVLMLLAGTFVWSLAVVVLTRLGDEERVAFVSRFLEAMVLFLWCIGGGVSSSRSVP